MILMSAWLLLRGSSSYKKMDSECDFEYGLFLSSCCASALGFLARSNIADS